MDKLDDLLQLIHRPRLLGLARQGSFLGSCRNYGTDLLNQVVLDDANSSGADVVTPTGSGIPDLYLY